MYKFNYIIYNQNSKAFQPKKIKKKKLNKIWGRFIAIFIKHFTDSTYQIDIANL
jgi:GH35 family endo-1,4-beta-xylanase